MSRLRTQHFNKENFKFKYDINVDKEGNFTTTLPENIVTEMQKVGIEFVRNRLDRDGFFSAKSLNELVDEVETKVKEYLKKELIEEKIIIRYAINTSCHYCLGKDGTIYPDGTFQKKVEEDHNWKEGTKHQFSMDNSPFGLEFGFELKRVQVWKFPNKDIKKEYHDLWGGDYEEGTTLEWIDSVRHISVDGTYKEIDYTEELGLLFKNLVLYIANMNEQFEKMFGKDVDLSKVDFKNNNLLMYIYEI